MVPGGFDALISSSGPICGKFEVPIKPEAECASCLSFLILENHCWDVEIQHNNKTTLFYHVLLFVFSFGESLTLKLPRLSRNCSLRTTYPNTDK